MKKILFYSLYTVWVLFCVFAGYVSLVDISYGGEGPDGPQVKISDVPDGYKIVKKESKCKDPIPCEDEKNKLKACLKEVDKLKARVKLLEDENAILKEAANEKKDCPKCASPKILYKEKPVEKLVEREKIVEKSTMKRNVFRLMGALGEDGITTEPDERDPNYSKEAETYYSLIGGVGYTRFLNDDFGLGIFGMFGGNTSKMIGLSGEIAF